VTDASVLQACNGYSSILWAASPLTFCRYDLG
jgi:hypothetical protein